MKRGLTAGDMERLVARMREEAESKARELRLAGWREDGFTLWRKSDDGYGYALSDAYDILTGRES